MRRLRNSWVTIRCDRFYHLQRMSILLRLGLVSPMVTALAGEWHAAAYLGGTHTASSSIQILQGETQVSLNDVSYSSRSFDSPVYYGYRIGRFFRPWFGVEGEFIHDKVYADIRRLAQNPPIVGRFDISHGTNLILFNAVFRRPLRERGTLGRIALTTRAGMGFSIPHPETTVLGESREQYEIGGLALQGAGGVEFRLWRGMYALAEYKFTYARMDLDIFGGTAETSLRTHHGVFGIGWRF
jgi:lipid A oxidase